MNDQSPPKAGNDGTNTAPELNPDVPGLPAPSRKASQVVRRLFFTNLIRHLDRDRDGLFAGVDKVFNIWMTMLEDRTCSPDWLIEESELEMLSKLPTKEIFLSVMELRRGFTEAAEQDWVIRDWFRVAPPKALRAEAVRAAKESLER